MRRLLLLPLLTLPALAQSALSPLKDHPLLKQAEAYLLAARKSLEAQAAPLALNVQGNYLRYGYTCEPEAVCASLPEAAQSLTLALVLTPFPFGEVADGVERAQIALRRAELAYRKTWRRRKTAWRRRGGASPSPWRRPGTWWTRKPPSPPFPNPRGRPP